MLNWMVSSSLLILLVLALRAVLKNRVSPRLRYALWLLVLVRLLVPGSLGSTHLSVLNAVEPVRDMGAAYVAEVPKPAAPAAGGTNGADGTVHATQPQQSQAQQPQQSQQSQLAQRPNGSGVQAGTQPTENKSVSLPDLLLVIWAVGAALTAASLLTTNVQFYVNLKNRRILVGKYRGVPVYAAGEMASPCLAGLLRPAIYLTPEVLVYEAARTHVMAHEYTHYRQLDYVWTVLRSVCLVLHWYNPLVWAAAAISRQDGELSCDAGAVKLLGEQARAAYGRTLVSLVTHVTAPSDLVRCATTMTGKKSALKERVTLLVKNPRTTALTLCLTVLVAALFGLSAFTGAADRGTENGGGEGLTGSVITPAAPEYGFTTMSRREDFTDEDGTELAYCELELPKLYVSNEDALTEATLTAARQAADTFNREMERRMEAHRTSAGERLRYAEEDRANGLDAGLPYYVTVSSSVDVQGQIVSAFMLIEDNSGGVHPNYGYDSALFDLGAGQFVEAKDMGGDPQGFTDGVAEALIAYAGTLGEDFQAEAFPDWRETVQNWPETGAARFDAEGLWVSFEPYALGPYALGGVELFAGYEDIRDLMDEYGLEKLGLSGNQKTGGQGSGAVVDLDGDVSGALAGDSDVTPVDRVQGMMEDLKAGENMRLLLYTENADGQRDETCGEFWLDGKTGGLAAAKQLAADMERCTWEKQTYVPAENLLDGQTLWIVNPVLHDLYMNEHGYVYFLDQEIGQRVYYLAKLPEDLAGQYDSAFDILRRIYDWNAPAAGQDAAPAYTRADMLAAYASILELAFSGESSPDGYFNYYDPAQTDPEEIAQNRFAVCDVDGDGQDELIINYSNTYMSGKSVAVYGYDPSTGEVRQELQNFSATLYANGYATVDASHNQGRNAMRGDWWPYTLYRYDAGSGTYQLVAYVESWDREQWAVRDGQTFPAEADRDGDGVVYYVAEDGWDYTDPMDGGAYESWVASWQGGAEKLDIPYRDFTWDNIHSLA